MLLDSFFNGSHYIASASRAKGSYPSHSRNRWPDTEQLFSNYFPGVDRIMARMLAFTDDNFNTEVVASPLPVLVEFGAVWCGPCKVLEPMIEEMAGEYDGRAKLGKLDMGENPDVAATYGVRSLPTIMIFKNGEVVEQIVGMVPRNKLVSMLESHVGATV